MYYFFIKVEKVVTSQGNKNRSHLFLFIVSFIKGHKLLDRDNKKTWRNTKWKKGNQLANNNEKNNNVCVLTIRNFLKQAHSIKMSNLLPCSHLGRLYGYSSA